MRAGSQTSTSGAILHGSRVVWWAGGAGKIGKIGTKTAVQARLFQKSGSCSGFFPGRLKGKGPRVRACRESLCAVLLAAVRDHLSAFRSAASHVLSSRSQVPILPRPKNQTSPRTFRYCCDLKTKIIARYSVGSHSNLESYGNTGILLYVGMRNTRYQYDITATVYECDTRVYTIDKMRNCVVTAYLQRLSCGSFLRCRPRVFCSP